MGNTADLAMIQKTIIYTLHKESKSQRVFTERGGCSRSAVSKHIKCKVDWKEEIGYEKVLVFSSKIMIIYFFICYYIYIRAVNRLKYLIAINRVIGMS